MWSADHDGNGEEAPVPGGRPRVVVDVTGSYLLSGTGMARTASRYASSWRSRSRRVVSLTRSSVNSASPLVRGILPVVMMMDGGQISSGCIPKARAIIGL